MWAGPVVRVAPHDVSLPVYSHTAARAFFHRSRATFEFSSDNISLTTTRRKFSCFGERKTLKVVLDGPPLKYVAFGRLARGMACEGLRGVALWVKVAGAARSAQRVHTAEAYHLSPSFFLIERSRSFLC